VRLLVFFALACRRRGAGHNKLTPQEKRSYTLLSTEDLMAGMATRPLSVQTAPSWA